MPPMVILILPKCLSFMPYVAHSDGKIKCVHSIGIYSVI